MVVAFNIGLDVLTCERVVVAHERLDFCFAASSSARPVEAQQGSVYCENNFTPPHGGDRDIFIPDSRWLRRRRQRANANTVTAVRAPHIGMHEGSSPWYSALTGDPDKYVDWWNGGRAVAQPPMRSIRSPQNLGPHSIR